MGLLTTAITTQLEHQLDTLWYLLEEFSETDIKRPTKSGKWSIFQHIAHLGRYQEFFQHRILQILQTDMPILHRYKAEDDPVFDVWQKKSLKEIRQQLISDRVLIRKTLFELTNEQYQRYGIHPVFGKMNLVDWVTFFLLHESHHVYAIFRIKGTYRNQLAQ